MPYMLIMMVVLVISWAMMVNIAKLVQERMMMQNAADNAALSIAAYKARVLNELGYLNFLIGCLLQDGMPGLEWGILFEKKPFFGEIGGIFNYDGVGAVETSYSNCSHPGFGILPMGIWDSQKHVGSVYDMEHGGCSGRDWHADIYDTNIERIRKTATGIIALQESIRLPFPMLAMNYARDIAGKQQINAKGEPCGADEIVIDPLFDIYHNSLRLGLERNENGVYYFPTQNFCVTWPPIPILDPDGNHTHLFWTSSPRKELKSWLYADNKKFHKTARIYVRAIKYGSSKSNKGYPILGRWFGIEWPTIETNAAAAVYNRNGPMFPVETKGAPSDDISPILDEYLKAKDGGWDAHLVPMGRYVKH